MASLRAITLAASLVSTSYFAFGNLAAAYIGVMAATAREGTTIPVVNKLALWDAFFHAAKFHMGLSGIFSAFALSAAAYVMSGGLLPKILAAGALAAFTSAAYTLLVMMPVNNDLMALLRASSVKPFEPKEEKHVLDQLDNWKSLHRVRMGLGFVAWMASATALFATESMIEL
ncbi:hypothetical protein B0H16DRAFT_1514888 [Mycena metata]|uniref:DUF1772-domain-containing protein n=1 Tax=Mycena metata TaxID=1033252 RepID=A0AAD7JY54_9AGAR|nr:hypothetical protein B0H16DRAFT_1514888 [Mycena metata]